MFAQEFNENKQKSGGNICVKSDVRIYGAKRETKICILMSRAKNAAESQKDFIMTIVRPTCVSI